MLVLCAEATAQGNRYMVFFANKNNTPYSINQPEAFLSARAIARRNRSAISITNDDLPVTPSYLAQVRATGAKTFFTSRWMNAVLVEATVAQATAVSALSIVTSVQQVAPGKKLIGGRSKQIRTKESNGSAQATQQQLQMLGLDSMRQDGFSGQGILVSIFDSGFPGVNTSV
ncbi:MAG: peptidase S8, partial [Cyclobacteriaceae bacterium]|nr:peptidase S8 [Cyclobacteriaceae bacterium]